MAFLEKKFHCARLCWHFMDLGNIVYYALALEKTMQRGPAPLTRSGSAEGSGVRYTLKQLTYFVSAAEQQSVTEAARLLNVSQPSISTAIAHLERVLAVQLFLRHHAQGLSLTPAGRRVFAEGRRLLAHADELAMAVTGANAPLCGAVDVGCFLTFSPYYLPALLRELKRQHPGLQVRLHEGDGEYINRGLTMGALDVAIVYDFGLGEAFTSEPLTALAPYALLPRGHKLARAAAVSLKALAKEPFVLLDLPLSREYFRSIFLRFGLEPNVAYRTTSYEMVRGLVANGHGVGLLNLKLRDRRSYDGKPLVSLPLVEPAPPLGIVLARVRDARLSRVADAFADCARSFFGGRRDGAAEISTSSGAGRRQDRLLLA
jgi:DNA-binding transcriptional LysR family regulator